MVSLFRIFPKYGVTNLPAIITNYFTCFLLGCAILGSIPIDSDLADTQWFPYALFLSLTFIIFFNVGAFSIQKIGLIITGIFQKLSLIFPVIIGILIFGESCNTYKVTAIILAISAIIMINIPEKRKSNEISLIAQYWYLPLLIIIGNGVIEVTIFFVEQKNLVVGASLDFVTTLFFLAGLWGLVFMLIKRKSFFKKRDIIAGVCLGIPNFFTIYLLLKALEIGWEGSVLFPVNNVATLGLTALVGLFMFKEKLNKFNYIGLLFAIIAVILISL